MSVGMVPLPAPPVTAPSANSCPSTTKPFACHTSEKSLKSSTSSDAAFFCRHPPSKPLCVTSLQEWGGGGGDSLTNFSFPSNSPNSPEDSSRQKLAAQKSGFVILRLKGGLSTRDETSHLHRSVPEYRAARLGLHQRPLARQIRFVVYRALAVCRTVANRKSGRRDYPRHRIPAHGRFGDSAGHGHCLEETGAQPADHCQEAHRTGEDLCAGRQFAQHADADTHPVRGKVEDCAGVR